MHGFYICINIFYGRKGKESKMNPIGYKKSIIHISNNAKQTAKKLYGEDLASLAIESIKTYGDNVLNTNSQVKQAAKSNNFIKKLMQKFQTKSQLIVSVDAEKNGDLFLCTQRKINDLPPLTGKKIPLDLLDTLNSHKKLDATVRESKEGILEEISVVNKNKRKYGFWGYLFN